MALALFAFVFWRDARSEGFGSDKILDTYFLILLGGLIGGKILFREISINYFRYEFLHSPLVLEGVLIGGAVAVYMSVKRNKWSAWKIGDMIAPALAIFQAVLFLGFWVEQKTLWPLMVFGGFVILYFFIRFLKKRHFGSSARFFELKRLNKLTFTGGLFYVYLTGSSVIAILFLAFHANLDSAFWRFQIAFYLVILIVSFFGVRRQLGKRKFKVKAFKGIKDKLLRRSKEIKKVEKDIVQKDPFMQEAQEGFRNLDEEGDEVADLQQHKDLEAQKKLLNQEGKEIEETLEKIKEGKYGICEVCGKKISKARLEAYPTATTCIEHADHS